MIEVGANLKGDVSAGLDKFEERLRQDVLISGAAAMARVVHDELKRNTSGLRKAERNVGAGKKTSTLHDAVYRTYSPSRSTDQQKVYHVGVNKKKAPHWHLLEYGHWQPYRAVLASRGWITLKDAKHTRKFIAPHPFIRPALSSIPAAISAGQARIAERLAEQQFIEDAVNL